MIEVRFEWLFYISLILNVFQLFATYILIRRFKNRKQEDEE